jgi:hypothetical protein
MLSKEIELLNLGNHLLDCQILNDIPLDFLIALGFAGTDFPVIGKPINAFSYGTGAKPTSVVVGENFYDQALVIWKAGLH